MKRVAVIAGRPEIIKTAPLIKVLQQKGIPSTFIHCRQPDYSYKVKACSHGGQTARIIVNMERLLKRIRPVLVLVRETQTAACNSLSCGQAWNTSGTC